MHELFKKRRSIRRFTPQKVSDDQLKQILTAAMVAPSANHLCPWEFLVVKDKEKLAKLAKCGTWQMFIKNAPLAIVVVGDPTKSEKQWLVDASIAAAHIYLEVTNQGLGTCWANVHGGQTGDGEDREEYVKEVLGVPEGKRVVCIMPIGYPAEEIKPHSEDEYEENKVHWENW